MKNLKEYGTNFYKNIVQLSADFNGIFNNNNSTDVDCKLNIRIHLGKEGKLGLSNLDKKTRIQ
jgi:hypothetical protein